MNEAALGRLLNGATIEEGAAPGSGIVYLRGDTVPSDAATGYAAGCIFIDTDAGGGTTFYINEGDISSADFNPASLSAVTATVAEINAAADNSAQSALIVPSSVITASAAAIKKSVIRTGDIVKTTMIIDLTGLKSSTTDLDIIGDTGISYIAQITAAVNGAIYKGQVSCGEVPTTGADDIDLYSATEGTGAYDAGIATLAETALMTAGGAHAIGTVKPLTALPAADEYLYLTCGEAGTPGTYDAGVLMIELWGTV